MAKQAETEIHKQAEIEVPETEDKFFENVESDVFLKENFQMAGRYWKEDFDYGFLFLNTILDSLTLLPQYGRPSTTNGCAAEANEEFVTNDIDLVSFAFDGTAIEYAQWTTLMPHNWDGGQIRAQFFVYPAAVPDANSVVFYVQGRSYSADLTEAGLADKNEIDQVWGTSQKIQFNLHDNLNAAIAVSNFTPWTTIAGTTSPGSMVQLRVYRDPTDAGDTDASDCNLVAVKIQYKINKLGQ